jgi:hypothetical protein
MTSDSFNKMLQEAISYRRSQAEYHRRMALLKGKMGP